MSKQLRHLAATTAVALAFAPAAQAVGLLDDDAAVLRYSGNLSNAIAAAAPQEPDSRTRARGFMVALEKGIKAAGDKIQIVDYPKPVSANMLRLTAVVPPKGFEALPIPVCAEQNNKVLQVWEVTSKGDVNVVAWSGARVSETPTSAACKAFILAKRAEMSEKLAQTTPAQPPPATTAAAGSSGTTVVATNTATTAPVARP